MKLVIEIDEARFKDIRRIASVQLENYHFKTAEQIIAKGVPIEQESYELRDVKAWMELPEPYEEGNDDK